MPNLRGIGARWLGVGLAACVGVVTISLFLTGRLGLFINPDSSWFAVSMAVIGVVGALLSFLLPLGAEADHGHDHGTAESAAAHSAVGEHELPHDHAHAHGHGAATPAPRLRRDRTRARREQPRAAHRPAPLSVAATATGAIVSTAVVGAMLLLPPASLSAQLAIERDFGAPPLFGGSDVVTLATKGDVSSFGIGEWSAVFATAPDVRVFEGVHVTLIGFVAPSGDDPDTLRLTRMVVTHCVIDAQPAAIPVDLAGWQADREIGQWIEVIGTVHENDRGVLAIDPQSVRSIPEPPDPYEY